ncbi:hypothetical protein EMPS_05611 [Entomortierella parvispora]|uniref:Rap-GAP domain-containing protein n=1 Tax=Entomortierella parvispora TaxID=205924 RepID=A0A9P3LWN6_9FUNG|nr:hypothetical protein EMPS_05611 [Entomortierella parvispora]
MFLDWIAQLGLLQHDPVSNVLARFPLQVRKTLITEVASTLLVSSDLTLLSSMAHMRWAMEVLGQGFALPLEELSIAQETTQLYSQWLFEPQMRPMAFHQAVGTEDEQLLYQTIFHHYSLLFQVRTTLPTPSSPHLATHHLRHQTTTLTGSSGGTASHHVPIGILIQRHIELCKKVLTVLTMAGRQLGNSFSTQTWQVLLKVILGITDSLLREQPSHQRSTSTMMLMPEQQKMSDDLCEHLLRVLFELWLRSNTREVQMWDILKHCFSGWTHRIPVLHQWAATVLGLCQRVVRLLYGPGQGTDVVNLAVGGYNIGLDLQADFALYAWHRMIYLLKSPAQLSPPNCLAAVNGIGRMVETFLLVGASSAQSSTLPGSPPLPSTPTDIFSSSSLSLSNQASSSPPSSSSKNPAPEKKPSSPDGNTILHMFGAWLFEVSSLPIPDTSNDSSGTSSTPSHWQTFNPHHPPDSYHEAQASAFGVLCRIFSKPQPATRPFLRIYTERFYEALSIGLRSETSLPTILAQSAELFTTELEGVRMMVPDFVIGIRMAMSGQIRVTTTMGAYLSLEKQKQILEDLHLAALKVAGCIICLPNHFEKVELKEGWNEGLSKLANMGVESPKGGPGSGGNGGSSTREDKEILAQLIRVLYTADTPTDGSVPASKRFTTLKYYILEMLLNCLETETSSFNLRYLLHLIEIYVYEDVAFCPGLVGVVVKTIQEKIVTVQVPVDVALCAFDVLVGCTGLYEYVRRDSKSCARELVLALCRYVDTLLANHSLLPTTYSLVVRAYECMLEWILTGQWIVGDQDCHLAVLSSISAGINIVEKVEEYEASIVPPKPQQEKRRWGGGAAGNAMISAVGAPLSLGKPSSSAAKLFQVNNKYPGPIKILTQESKKERENRKNRSASSSMSGHQVKIPFATLRQDLSLIQQAAEKAMTLFSNQLGNFPVWTDDIGPSRMSTLWNDLGINRLHLEAIRKERTTSMEGGGDGQLYNSLGGNGPPPLPHRSRSDSDTAGPVRYFLLDRRIIVGCCESPPAALSGTPSGGGYVDERGPFVVVTMRDASGRNSWKVRVSSLEQQHQLQQQQYRMASISASQSRRSLASSKATADMESADLQEDGEDSESYSGSGIGGVSTIGVPEHRVLLVEAADETRIGLRRYVRPPASENDDDETNTGRDEDSFGGSKVAEPEDLITTKQAFDEGESIPEPMPPQLQKQRRQIAMQTPTSSVFRILMAQMGYLSLENRSRIVPLHLSDRLLAELQFLDDLKERDCIGISVYFAQSGDVSYDELIHGSPQGLPKDFSRFLDCLGWPIQLETHSGYTGHLNSTLCHTTPYFADRKNEVIFHVPYLMRSTFPAPSPSSEGYSSAEIPRMLDHQLVDQFRSVTLQDRVAVVWVEDRERMLNLLPLLLSNDQSLMVFLLIHPLGGGGDSAGGLFWIRIVVPQGITTATAGSVRLAANPLMIGPLADGMLVSRHSLGSLVRNTAISADRACRLMMENFSEPSVARARYIQEVLHNHQQQPLYRVNEDEGQGSQQQHASQPAPQESVAEFYRTMFAT